MNTQVEFRSSKFPPYPNEDEEVNPGLWGKRLAEYLHAAFEVRGVEIGEILAEDWGWILPIQNPEFKTWIGCGHNDEYEDSYLVFIEPSQPTIRKGLFKKVDTTPTIERLVKLLDQVLTSYPEIREIHWRPAE